MANVAKLPELLVRKDLDCLLPSPRQKISIYAAIALSLFSSSSSGRARGATNVTRIPHSSAPAGFLGFGSAGLILECK
jgi:hypothetical protein